MAHHDLPNRAPFAWSEFARYFVVSAGALTVDTVLFRSVLGAGLSYPVAALAGFLAGAVVAYVASVRWVFRARAVRNPALEFGLFAAVGAVGLGLTEAFLWIGIGLLHQAPVPAKLCTAGLVFLFNFGVRKAVLFTSRPAPASTEAMAGANRAVAP